VTFEQLDLDQLQDVAQAKRAIVGLLNLVADLQACVRQLQAENQRLRDEINHLKGEQGKPDIKPNRRRKAPGPGSNHSSEAERRKPQAWHKSSKLAQIKIDHEEVLHLDPAQLPADAEFKGYEDSLVQDVVIHTANVLYHKELSVTHKLGVLSDYDLPGSG
jgi:regulator of replication initiation timing